MPRGAGGSQGNGNGKDFEMLKEPFQSPASASPLWAFWCVPEPVSLLPCRRGPDSASQGFRGRVPCFQKAAQDSGFASFLFSS